MPTPASPADPVVAHRRRGRLRAAVSRPGLSAAGVSRPGLSGPAWLAIISTITSVIAALLVVLLLGLLPPDELAQISRLAD